MRIAYRFIRRPNFLQKSSPRNILPRSRTNPSSFNIDITFVISRRESNLAFKERKKSLLLRSNYEFLGKEQYSFGNQKRTSSRISMISHDPVPARSSVMPAPKSESFPTPFKPKLCNEIDHLGAYSFSPTSQMGYPSTLHTRENLASTDNISTPRICNKICNKIRTNETTTRIATRDSSWRGIIFPRIFHPREFYDNTCESRKPTPLLLSSLRRVPRTEE